MNLDVVMQQPIDSRGKWISAAPRWDLRTCRGSRPVRSPSEMHHFLSVQVHYTHAVFFVIERILQCLKKKKNKRIFIATYDSCPVLFMNEKNNNNINNDNDDDNDDNNKNLSNFVRKCFDLFLTPLVTN